MKKILVSALLALGAASTMAADVFNNPNFGDGNQNWTGMLGNDFVANSNVTVSAIGAFTGGTAGFAGTITVGLYDITNLNAITTVISPLSFSGAGGATPYTWQSASAVLQAGHTYSVQASGYGSDQIGNNGISGSIGFDTLGGALTQGSARWANSSALGVAGTDTGPFTFAAGNVQLAQPVPEPETYAMLLAGLGLIGGIARRRKQKTATA
jgi:hypothetical protein